MRAVLGVDTSCYTTSAALVSLEGSLIASRRRLLEVEEGELTEFLRTLFDNMRPLAQQKGISMEMAV